MTIPSENPSFSVVLRAEDGDHILRHFTSDSRSLLEEDYIPEVSLRENQDISIRFTGPRHARLTLDGLDVVPVAGAEESSGVFMLLPSPRLVSLFTAGNFPLVPGYYVLTVQEDSRTWYTGIEIVPRHMEKQQWQEMRDELRGEIRDLAFDFMKRNMNISRPLSDAFGVSEDMLLRFYIISDTFSQVMAVLDELGRSANSCIRKTRERARSGACGGREQCVRPGSGGSAPGRVPGYRTVKQVTWDVPENRFVKSVLINLQQCLRSFSGELEHAFRQTQAEQKLDGFYKNNYQYTLREEALSHFRQYQKRAFCLQAAIRSIAQTTWFQETSSERTSVNTPLTVFMDPRYRLLRRLGHALQHPEKSLAGSSFYLFQWKRTDKLYELWCYLHFLKALAEKGWEMTDGPAIRKTDGQYRLESLESGTAITLKRGEDRVRLVYDALIPDTASETDRDENPLYTNNPRRRPDCRLDYYRKGLYCGSLVADFKYRNVYHIWNDERGSVDLRLQFNAYRDVNTKYYLDMDELTSRRDSRPVKEVWAVFPKEIQAVSDEDYNLRFISLAPGLESNRLLPELLEQYFQGLQ